MLMGYLDDRDISPEERRRRRMAMELLDAQDDEPITHPMQGVAKIAQGYVAGRAMRNAMGPQGGGDLGWKTQVQHEGGLRGLFDKFKNFGGG